MVIKACLIGRQFTPLTQGYLIPHRSRCGERKISRRIQSQCALLLALSRTVQGDKSHHLCHPCPEIRARLELIEFLKSQKCGFLHNIFSDSWITNNAHGHQPEHAKTTLELSAEIHG